MKKATTRVLAVLFTAAALTAGLDARESVADEPIVGLGIDSGTGGLGPGGGGFGLGRRTVPTFGVMSHHVPGFGMFVQRVLRGSEAERQTLEPYDMIVAVNGGRLDDASAFENEIRDAVSYDSYGRPYGRVTLTIRNCRDGSLVRITTDMRNW